MTNIIKNHGITREQAIREIEGLFPPDSQYEESREIGIELLEEAKRRCNNWRNESDDVIFMMFNLCRDKEREQTRNAERKTY
jgi:hypothetical protein